ncbi:MAG: C-methyltransferase [Parcubacteria group bacterium Gr01-1014_46]|nr:MAG: C-methyltransferase [Parcubacteria group bacterium Gr01-1014_46]
MSQSVYKKEICGMCEGTGLVPVLDLGEMPVSNAFLKKEDLNLREPFYPLSVQVCTNCKSLQLVHIVPSELIFKNYSYTTGASKPLVEHFHRLADDIAENHIENQNELVIEIGSNDGSLLSRLKGKTRILGIDPADNIAKLAEDNSVPTRVDFFDSKLAEDILHNEGPAKVIVANNVMAHINNIKDVFTGVKILLSPKGQFIFEVHWVGNLLTDGGFDQIYHEHFYYHSLHSLKHLIDSLGMVVRDVKSIPIHGESIRVYVGLSGDSSKNVENFLKREVDMGLADVKTYQDFSKKVESNKHELKSLLSRLKETGKRIVGYGAPAKGNTLLNYFKIGPDIIDYITDTTPSKQGAFTPGSRILIVSPENLKKEIPDYILLLSWNYADSILEKEKELREKGVKFIIPVPTVRIV